MGNILDAHPETKKTIKSAWINILIYTQLFIDTYYIHLNILYFCVHISYAILKSFIFFTAPAQGIVYTQ